MGCFNKNCVVTGLQIESDDPIVGIKLRKSEHLSEPFSHIRSEWYPIEFPVRGRYDNYGRIEVDGKLYEGNEDTDYDSTRCDDYMFMHEWAYDHILEYGEKRKREWDARYGDTFPNWEKKERENLKTLFDKLAEEKESASQYWLTISSIRYAAERYLQRYFGYGCKEYWHNRLFVEDYDEYMKGIDRFSRELGSLENWCFEFGFRWRPSYIGNQEVDYDTVIGMHIKSLNYLNEKAKEYGEDY